MIFWKADEQCGELETIPHTYDCESLNENKSKIKYDEIYNGNLTYKIEVFRRLEKSIEKSREIKMNDNFPCDLRDPLDCLSVQIWMKYIYGVFQSQGAIYGLN